MPKLILTREVTPDECHWLDRPFKKGEVIHTFSGYTYGCISDGVACSLDGGTPFFELPADAVQPESE